MESYSISQVAQRFGVEPHTLRFYEKEGIIHPGRTKNGIRVYSQENVALLEMAMCLKSTGIALKGNQAVFRLGGAGRRHLGVAAATSSPTTTSGCSKRLRSSSNTWRR